MNDRYSVGNDEITNETLYKKVKNLESEIQEIKAVVTKTQEQKTNGQPSKEVTLFDQDGKIDGVGAEIVRYCQRTGKSDKSDVRRILNKNGYSRSDPAIIQIMERIGNNTGLKWVKGSQGGPASVLKYKKSNY